MSRRRGELEGAACAELPMQVVDHFFDDPPEPRGVYIKAAKNICGRCVVRPECLLDALTGPKVDRGIIAGFSAYAINIGRSWIAYESGSTEVPPKHPRPDWLPRLDSAEAVELARLQDDDEPRAVAQ